MLTFERWICDPSPFVVANAIATVVAFVAGTDFAIATACQFLRLAVLCGPPRVFGAVPAATRILSPV